MYRAEISITLFKIVGIWPSETSRGFFTIYNVFSVLVVSLTFLFTASSLLYLLQENLKMDEFIENFFYFLTLLVACIKMVIIFHKRSKINEITKILHHKQFEPRDLVEKDIQSKFDKIGRSGTIAFVTIVLLTTAIRAVVPFIKGDKTLLPFKTWIPFEVESQFSFWSTYIFQNLGATAAGQATVAGDTFAVVMMLQLCAQVEILIHRMEVFPELCKTEFFNNPEKEQMVLSKWIQHHNSLYLFRNKLNDAYNLIFLFQLLITTLEVCTITYLLSTISITSMKFWSTIMTMNCIMFEICIYCWNGNMVIEKSQAIGSAAFSIDWVSLTKRTRSSLLQIIKQSNTPIKFTAGSIVPLSIDTFSSILRLAYSIYNCLMRH